MMGKHSQVTRSTTADRAHDTLGSARYIGRVGALAIALGVGTAVATGHGVAWAEPSDSGSTSGSTDSSSSGSAGPSTSGPSSNDASTGSTPTDTTLASAGSSGSTTTTSGSTTSSAGTAPKTTVSAQTTTSTADTTTPTTTDADADISKDPTDPVVTEPVVTNPADTDDAGAIDPPPVVEPPTDSAPVPPTDPPAAPGGSDTPPPAADSARLANSVSTPGPAFGKMARTTAGPDVQPALDDSQPAADTARTLAVATNDSPTTMATFATAAVAPALPSSLTAPVTVRSIISDVLRWFGLPPLATDSPIPATPVPPPLEALWFFVRRVEYTFFNDMPTATHTVDPQNPRTGVITGRIVGADTDGDALTYTVTTQPSNGTVVVDGQGNYIYTPDEDTAENGGTDTFTVTIDDRPGNPAHLHGPLDLFGLVAPTTETVSLTVVPVNAPPEFADPAFEIDAIISPTGVVIGHVNASDDDTDDTLSYGLGAAPDPTIGTVDVDPLSGQWVFTPTPQARLDAQRSTSLEFATFTVTVTDGRDTVTTTVLAPLDATQAAPVVLPDGYQIRGPVVARPDGTAYQTIYKHDPESNTFKTSVMLIRPTNASPTTIIDIDGFPVGAVVLGPDGTAYQTIRQTDPASNAVTTVVAVISPTGTTTTINIDGAPRGGVVLGPDGTVVQTTAGVDAAGVGQTTTAVIRPDNPNPMIVTLAGSLSSPAVVGPDGTVYQTASNDDFTWVATIEPGNPAVMILQLDGFASGSVVLAPDGTPYQVTLSYGAATNSYQTKVTSLNGLTVIVADGLHQGPLVIGPDGTLYLTTSRVPTASDASSTRVTILRPTDANPLILSVQGSTVYPVTIGADGTAYQTTERYNSATGTRTTDVLIVGDGDIPPIIKTIVGRPAGPVIVGPDGSAYQITVVQNDFGYATLMSRLGTTGANTDLIGEFRGVTFGADGTAYVTTYDDVPAFDVHRTHVSVVATNGDISGDIRLDGAPIGSVVLGPDGTAYQMIATGDPAGGEATTTVAIISADGTNPNTIVVDGQARNLVIAPDGFAYLTTTIEVGDTIRSMVWLLDARGTAIEV